MLQNILSHWKGVNRGGKLEDDNLKLITDVKDVWQQDQRWTKEIAEKFVSLLQQFAKDTKFDDFFRDNIGLYTDAVRLLIPIYEQVDLNWYYTFFGKGPSETFSIIMGPGNGGNNYGPSLEYTNGYKKAYAIIGVWAADSTGMPQFNEGVIVIVLHEFCHSFVNQLIYNNWDAFKEVGEKIYPIVKNKTPDSNYSTWDAIMCEALVRASVIKYLKDHKFEQGKIEMLINYEKECGFYWIEELVAELEKYNKQRDKYPSLESYIPKIIDAYKIWADQTPTNTPFKE